MYETYLFGNHIRLLPSPPSDSWLCRGIADHPEAALAIRFVSRGRKWGFFRTRYGLSFLHFSHLHWFGSRKSFLETVTSAS
jgi:hypothetical protein